MICTCIGFGVMRYLKWRRERQLRILEAAKQAAHNYEHFQKLRRNHQSTLGNWPQGNKKNWKGEYDKLVRQLSPRMRKLVPSLDIRDDQAPLGA